MRQVDMVNPFLTNLLKKARTIICSCLPDECRYELYLIGSAARGELTLLFESGDIACMSDVEFYLLAEVSNIEQLIPMMNKKLSAIQGISVEVNGTTFQRFNRYSPKQWLIDAAHCSRLVDASDIVSENCFVRFYRSEIPRENFVTLLLNRVIEYEKESDFYFLVKLFVDSVGVMLALIGQYSVLIEKRVAQIGDTDIYDELQAKLSIPKEFLHNALIVLGYKLYPSKSVGSFLESKKVTLEKQVYEVVRLLLLQLLSSDKTNESVAVLYQRYLSKRGLFQTLKEWLQDSSIAPLKAFLLAFQKGVSISPRSRVFFNAAQNLDSDDPKVETQELYESWRIFCKSA